jgi:hydrogenase nickel insertion protein HypA
VHEVALMRRVVTTALDHMRRAGGTRITRVELALGTAGHLTEEAVRQTFALCAAGTPAAGATISISWLPTTYHCLGCLRRFTLTMPTANATCPHCGTMALAIEQQDICRVRRIDVALPDEPASPVAVDRLPGPA